MTINNNSVINWEHYQEVRAEVMKTGGWGWGSAYLKPVAQACVKVLKYHEQLKIISTCGAELNSSHGGRIVKQRENTTAGFGTRVNRTDPGVDWESESVLHVFALSHPSVF